MNPVFQPGEEIFIKPGTYHNSGREPRAVVFVRYMAGKEFSIVETEWSHLRVAVNDLSY